MRQRAPRRPKAAWGFLVVRSSVCMCPTEMCHQTWHEVDQNCQMRAEVDQMGIEIGEAWASRGGETRFVLECRLSNVLWPDMHFRTLSVLPDVRFCYMFCMAILCGRGFYGECGRRQDVFPDTPSTSWHFRHFDCKIHVRGLRCLPDKSCGLGTVLMLRWMCALNHFAPRRKYGVPLSRCVCPGSPCAPQ